MLEELFYNDHFPSVIKFLEGKKRRLKAWKRVLKSKGFRVNVTKTKQQLVAKRLQFIKLQIYHSAGGGMTSECTKELLFDDNLVLVTGLPENVKGKLEVYKETLASKMLKVNTRKTRTITRKTRTMIISDKAGNVSKNDCSL